MSSQGLANGNNPGYNVVDALLSFVERTCGISQAHRRRLLDQAALALYNTQATPRSSIDASWDILEQMFPTARTDAAWRALFFRLVSLRHFVNMGWGPLIEAERE